MYSSTTTCGGDVIVFWHRIFFYKYRDMFMCVSRGNMWLLCVCVKKGSFHPVNRYSFFFAINVEGEKFVSA